MMDESMDEEQNARSEGRTFTLVNIYMYGCMYPSLLQYSIHVNYHTHHPCRRVIASPSDPGAPDTPSQARSSPPLIRDIDPHPLGRMIDGFPKQRSTRDSGWCQAQPASGRVGEGD